MHPNHENLIHVAHFEVTLHGTPITVGDLSWDGPCLILRRPLEKGGKSLISELVEAPDAIRVKLFGPTNEAGEREVTHEWRVVHAGLRNRGLDFLHAARLQYAKEAVALVDAELIQVNK